MMALDIYCGPLSRYYAGRWENVLERWAKAQGVDYRINRKRLEDEGEPLGDEALREQVLAWQGNLQTFLQSRHGLSCQWREDEDAPYTSGRPDWSAYWLLILRALYHEQNEVPFEEVPAGFQPSQDRVFERHTMPGYETAYPMLTSEAELFLPINDAVRIDGLDALNQPVAIASSVALLAELQQLNQALWQADEAEIAAWREDYNRVLPRLDGDKLVIDRKQAVDRFDEVAKYGFAVLYELCRFAVDNGVAMRLDW